MIVYLDSLDSLFQEEKSFEAIDLIYKTSQDQVKEDLDSSINKLKDIIDEGANAGSEQTAEVQNKPETINVIDSNNGATLSETTDSEQEAAPVKKKKKKRTKKKKPKEDPTVEPVIAETIATDEVKEQPEVVAEVNTELVVTTETVSEPSPIAAPEIPEEVSSESVNVEVTDEVAKVEVLLPQEDLTSVSPFEIPETLIQEESVSPEELESTSEPMPDPSVGVIETVIESALDSDPVTEAPVEQRDEAEMIMDALKSLDYEPVLSDTVLDLLVGKAANREKAVIATISRLENAMANVVNEVQNALEHHNKTSALVTLAKLNAQSISEATSKESAKELLDKLLKASTDVREAFAEGERINTQVTGAFNKLSEVVDKAEQFDLKGKLDGIFV